jgi:hypothetical protein
MERIIKWAGYGIKGLDYASPAVDLGVRLWVADVFWNSGLTKVQSWYSTVQLFTGVFGGDGGNRRFGIAGPGLWSAIWHRGAIYS